jgi:FolB domain-containing protein
MHVLPAPSVHSLGAIGNNEGIKKMSEDRIVIKDLLLRGIIGINDWEREKEQDILINITLSCNLREAGGSDRIEDTVNYRTLTKKIIKHVDEASRYTVEALAADIAKLCLNTEGVERALVRVEKPGALRFAESVGVEIERSLSDID